MSKVKVLTFYEDHPLDGISNDIEKELNEYVSTGYKIVSTVYVPGMTPEDCGTILYTLVKYKR